MRPAISLIGSKSGSRRFSFDGLVGDARRAGRQEAFGKRPVRGEVEISEENLVLTEQSALRDQRFLHLDDQIGSGKDFLVRGNNFRAGQAIIAVVVSDSRASIRFHDNLMPALDELVDCRWQQCHTKFLFLDLPRYAHGHSANIFTPPRRDKFFALTWKSGN